MVGTWPLGMLRLCTWLAAWRRISTTATRRATATIPVTMNSVVFLPGFPCFRKAMICIYSRHLRYARLEVTLLRISAGGQGLRAEEYLHLRKMNVMGKNAHHIHFSGILATKRE